MRATGVKGRVVKRGSRAHVARDHGVRAGEIVHLRVGDVDWKNASIRVCGKGGRVMQLPLAHEVGQALVAYVQMCADGQFHLPNLDEGRWTIRVEMPGIRTLSRDVAVGDGAPASEWPLAALPLDLHPGWR